MAPKKQMPEFASESEEAKWLYDHRDELDAYTDTMTDAQVAEAKADLAKLKRSEAISLRLPASDLARAKTFAEQKGVGYQTYLKSLIHDGLDHEEQQRLMEVATLLAGDIDRLIGAVSKSPGYDADLFQHLQKASALFDRLGLGPSSHQTA